MANKRYNYLNHFLNFILKFAIEDKTKKFSASFKNYQSQKIVNNVVSTESTSSCRIKGVLDICGKIVNNPKCVGNLMKKKL